MRRRRPEMTPGLLAGAMAYVKLLGGGKKTVGEITVAESMRRGREDQKRQRDSWNRSFLGVRVQRKAKEQEIADVERETED